MLDGPCRRCLVSPNISPRRRVRDAVGPSPAAARVERCVYITNPLMVRPNGSPASAIARQRGFQLPLLLGRPKVGLGIYIYSCHAGELFGFVPVARDEQAFSC